MTRSSRRLTLHQIYSDDVPPLADSTWQQLPKLKPKSQKKSKPKGAAISHPLHTKEPQQSGNCVVENTTQASHPPTSAVQYRPTRLPTIRTLLNKVQEAGATTTAQNVLDMCSFYNKPYSLVSDLNLGIEKQVNTKVSLTQAYPSPSAHKITINYLLNEDKGFIDKVISPEVAAYESPDLDDFQRSYESSEDIPPTKPSPTTPIFDPMDLLHCEKPLYQ